MSLKLMTKCKDCIFNKNSKCFIGRKTQDFVLDETVVGVRTEGYCNFKRNKNWYSQKAKDNEEYSLSFAMRDIMYEEVKISPIVVVDKLCHDSIDKFCESLSFLIKKDIIEISPVVFIVQTSDGAWLNLFSAVVDKYKETIGRWTLVVMSDEEEVYTFSDMVHRAYEEIGNTNWFIPMSPDDRLRSEDITVVKHYIKDNETSAAAILIHQKEEHPLPVINKWAFKNMGGNVDGDFIGKIKEFDNWEEVCLTTN